MNHIQCFLVPHPVTEGPWEYPWLYANRMANVCMPELASFVDWFGGWADATPNPIPYITDIDTCYYGPRTGLILCLSGDAATPADMTTVLDAWESERQRRRAAEECRVAEAVVTRIRESEAAAQSRATAANQLALL